MNSWATGSEPRRSRRRRAGTISFSDSLLAARRLKVAAQHRHRAAAINDRPATQRFGPAVRFHINNPSHRRAASRLTGSMATAAGACRGSGVMEIERRKARRHTSPAPTVQREQVQ